MQGDHCLGVPGVVQRMSLDRVTHPVRAHFPASGREYFGRLRAASVSHDVLDLREEPLTADGPGASGPSWALEGPPARPPRRDVRLSAGRAGRAPDATEELARAGVAGPDVGRLQRAGSLEVGGRTVRLADVSALRPGQRVAFVVDTRMCDAVHALADGADLLVIESTFLEEDAALAREYGHLTARQAATVAAECGVRRLVITHFSQRYPDPARFADEAAAVFPGDLVVAHDLVTVPVPRRS